MSHNLRRLCQLIAVTAVLLGSFFINIGNSYAQTTSHAPIITTGNGYPQSIAASPDGNYVIVGSTAGLHFFDPQTLAPLAHWKRVGTASNVAYSQDGQYIRINDNVYLADINVPYAAVDISMDEIEWIQKNCAPDGSYCATTRSYRGSVWIEDMNTTITAAIFAVENWKKYVWFETAWSADGQSLYILNGSDWRHKHIEIRETTNWELLTLVDNYFSTETLAVTWSQNSQYLALDNEVWDMATQAPLYGDPCAIDTSLCAETSESATALPPAIRSEAYDFFTWGSDRATNTSKTLAVISGNSYRWKCRHLNDDYMLTAQGQPMCSENNGSTIIWDLQTQQKLVQLPIRLENVIFPTNHNDILIGAVGKRIEVWNWKTNSLVQTMQARTVLLDWHRPDRVFIIPNQPDIIAIISKEQRGVQFWNWKTGIHIHTFEATNENQVDPNISFSKDGTKMIIRGYDQLSVWDTVSYTQLFQYEAPPNCRSFSMQAIEFSPDGQKLFIQFFDQQVLVWQL